MDFANFVRAGLKELGGLGTDGWRAFRRGVPKGIERGAAQAGKALVVGGIATLMHTLGSDIAALGSMVAAYAPQFSSACPTRRRKRRHPTRLPWTNTGTRKRKYLARQRPESRLPVVCQQDPGEQTRP